VNSQRTCAGFTLLELGIVVMLLAIVLSVALPRMLPLIAFGRLEGSARHVAAYGRSAAAHCAIEQERITIKFDLDEQEYWAVRWLESTDDEELFDNDGLFGEGGGLFGGDESAGNSDDPLAALAATTAPGSTLAQEEEMLRFEQQFERFGRLSTQSRMRNVKRDEMFAGTGELFGNEFSLGADDEDTEELKTSLLGRTWLPDGVVIENIRLGSTDHTAGLVQVDVTPLGLGQPVLFHLRSSDDDYFTVIWDPITGNSRLSRGKEELD
jgi:hypothetical protein